MRHERRFAAVPALALLVAVAFGAGAPAQTAPPNLTLTAFAGPACAEIGETVGGQITFTMTNTGPGNLPGAPVGTDCSGETDNTCTAIGFYISLDANITTNDTLLSGGREFLVDQLVPGAPFNVGDTASDFLFSGADVATGSPTGNVYLGVIVDELTTVSEADETDNTAAVAIQIVAAGSGGCGVAQPDLVISSFTHEPTNPTTADGITLKAVVKNLGGAAAGPSVACIDVGGESCSNATAEMLFDVPNLGAGQSFEVERSIGLDVAQSYLNNAVADVEGEVAESNEANNTASDSFVVTEATTVALIYQVVSLPEHGTLQGLTGCSFQTPCSLPSVEVTYEPDAGFVGTDSFEFQVLDSRTGLTSVSAAIVGLLVVTQAGFGADLTVDFLGSGRGDVAMDVGGTVKAICDDDCTESFAPGQAVKLQARPVDEYTFAGWGGACNVVPQNSQVATVTLPLSGGSSCTATFSP